jgi:hypothetical protein
MNIRKKVRWILPPTSTRGKPLGARRQTEGYGRTTKSVCDYRGDGGESNAADANPDLVHDQPSQHLADYLFLPRPADTQRDGDFMTDFLKQVFNNQQFNFFIHCLLPTCSV